LATILPEQKLPVNTRLKTEDQNRIEDAPKGKIRLQVQSQTQSFDRNFLDPLWSARWLPESKSIALCGQRSTLTLLLHQAMNHACDAKENPQATGPGNQAQARMSIFY
jgi:hypothetical protein